MLSAPTAARRRGPWTEINDYRPGRRPAGPGGQRGDRALLKRLRGSLSLRDVNQRTGISSSYLSQIERGERMPGRNMVGKLAAIYNVNPEELMKRAGHTGQPYPNSNEVLEVERAYRYVLADPQFRVGTRPDGPLSINAKRFIVEMYERFTGKRLLE